MDDLLIMLGTTGQLYSKQLKRVDNNTHAFLGTQHQPQTKKEGERKPLLIPDFISTATYNASVENDQEIGGFANA